MASASWSDRKVNAIQLIQNIDQRTIVFRDHTVVQNYRDARSGNVIKYYGQNKCEKYDALLQQIYTRRFRKPVYLVVTTGSKVMDMVKVVNVTHFEPRTATEPPYITFTFERINTRQFLRRPRAAFALNEFGNVSVTRSALMRNLMVTRTSVVPSGIQEVTIQNREFLQQLRA